MKSSFIVIIIVLLTASCMDQDPFGFNTKNISGSYYLEFFPDGQTYYLERSGYPKTGVGYLEGIVKEIGWDDQFIYAKRYSCFRGDPDGWMIINLKNHVMIGPLSDTDFKYNHPNVKIYLPQNAWKIL